MSPISCMAEYSIPFSSVNNFRLLKSPRFIILFWQTDLCPLTMGGKIYWSLREDDPEKAPPPVTQLAKTEAMRIFTVTKFEDMSMRGTFWCRENVLDEMQREGGWKAVVLRVDS